MAEPHEQTTGLLEKYAQVNMLLERYRHCVQRGHGDVADPHRGQGRVLVMLNLQPEISQKDLGYLLNMRKQSLGELLSKLERSGYVARTPSEADKRAMMVRLTPAGQEKAAMIEKGLRTADNPLDELPAEDQAQLALLLDKVLAILSEKLGPESLGEVWTDGCFSGFPSHEARLRMLGAFARRAGFGGMCPEGEEE